VAQGTATRSAASDSGSILYVCVLSSVAALGGLLFGYDTGVISGAIGFLRLDFDLDPQWATGWAAACALVGCAIGAAAAGMLSDRLGRKKVLMLSALAFFISALGTALPQNITQFIIFRMIGGLGIGAASMTSPMYIAEITPARIRGRMVSVNQLAIVSGMVIVYFVNYFIAGYGTAQDRAAASGKQAIVTPDVAHRLVTRYAPDLPPNVVDEVATGKSQRIGRSGSQFEQIADRLKHHDVAVEPTTLALVADGKKPWNEAHGWRWMFGSCALPAILLFSLLLIVPESPRWLVKQGYTDRAMAVLTRVAGAKQAQVELADIRDTVAHESGSLAQLFHPGMRLVLVIGVALAILQQVTGINVFLYYAPEIFKKMGSGTDVALLETVIVGGVNMLFTIIAIWSVDRLGRKPLMLVGSTGMGLALVAMGLAAYFKQTQMWVLACILGYIACFALSVGPVVWVILSEIFPTRIRGRAMAIATVCLWLANYVVTQTFTLMDGNPTLVATFHHGFPFFVYAAFCVATFLLVWLGVPETKGKTLEEIERGWLR
jgi:MFS family permease